SLWGTLRTRAPIPVLGRLPSSSGTIPSIIDRIPRSPPERDSEKCRVCVVLVGDLRSLTISATRGDAVAQHPSDQQPVDANAPPTANVAPELATHADLGEDQPHVWVEKTIVHGRPDRQEGRYALGHALWSPRRAKNA